MKKLDRVLQNWRIRKAAPFIVDGSNVLDVGCADGPLFRLMNGKVERGVGIDRDAVPASTEKFSYFRGDFPDDLPQRGPFSAIVMLAVFEHVPPQARKTWVDACARLLKSQGRVILTVPSPTADTILDVLRFCRLIHGMDLEHHTHLEISEIPMLFSTANFRLVHQASFELGFNNLLVFSKF